jgi:heme exporter protein D
VKSVGLAKKVRRRRAVVQGEERKHQRTKNIQEGATYARARIIL